MTGFNLFPRFGYIWYICPVSGDEKKTAFRADLIGKPTKQVAELAKLESFKKYGMDARLATAVMGFIVTGSESQVFITA